MTNYRNNNSLQYDTLYCYITGLTCRTSRRPLTKFIMRISVKHECHIAMLGRAIFRITTISSYPHFLLILLILSFNKDLYNVTCRFLHNIFVCLFIITFTWPTFSIRISCRVKEWIIGWVDLFEIVQQRVACRRVNWLTGRTE